MCFCSDVFSDDGSRTLMSVRAIKYEVKVTVEFLGMVHLVLIPSKLHHMLPTMPFPQPHKLKLDGEMMLLVTIGKTLYVFIFSADTDISVAVTTFVLQDSLSNILATPVDGTDH